MVEGWSVRALEAKARAAAGKAPAPGGTTSPGRPPARGSALHPDQEEAVAEIAATMGAALGREVQVSAGANGYRVQFSVASADEARRLASATLARRGGD